MKLKCISFKTILNISIVFVTAIVVNSYLTVTAKLENNIESNKKNILANLKEASKEIDNMNTKSVTIANSISLSQENGLYELKDESDLLRTEIMRFKVLKDYEIFVARAGLEPTTFGL